MENSEYSTQLIAGIAASISMTCIGFHLGWSSPSLPKLLADDSDVPITSGEGAWIVGFLMLGTASGAIISIVLVNRWGRKWSLLCAVIPYVVSAILLCVARSFWWFLLARLIGGLGCGITYTIMPMYLGEIADCRIRGALGAMINFMSNAGILLTYSIGPWVSRIALACFGGTLPILFGLMFIWMPESPYFLTMKNKPIETERSLTWFRGKRDVTEELNDIRENVENDRRNAGTLSELVTVPGNRRALIIVLGLIATQQFSGISIVLSYGSLIFEESGSTLNANIPVIIIGVVQILSGGVTIFTVDLVGRRPLLMLSVCGVIVFLSAEALFFQLQALGTDVSSITWLPATALIGYILLYEVGLGSLPHAILSELFPCSVKAQAAMVYSITGALIGMAVTKIYQLVADEFGTHVGFWGFSVVTIFSTIFIYFVLPETKQKSLGNIQDELHKNCPIQDSKEKIKSSSIVASNKSEN